MQELGYDEWLCLGKSVHYLRVFPPKELLNTTKLRIEFYSERDSYFVGNTAMKAFYSDEEIRIEHESNSIELTTELKALLDRMISKLQD